MGKLNIIREREREMGFVSDSARPGEKQGGEMGKERQEGEKDGKRERDRERTIFSRLAWAKANKKGQLKSLIINLQTNSSAA